MGPLEQEELRRLRLRAYGPSADIDRDPAAMARLTELEAAAGTGDASDTPAPEPHRDNPSDPRPKAPADASMIDASLVDEAAPVADGDPAVWSSSPDTRRRPRWLVPALWAASLAITAVFAAIVTSTASSPPTAAPDGGTPVAVLAPDPSFDPSEIFGTRGYGAQGFEDFHGLTPIAVDDRWAASFGTDSCLMIVATGVVDGDDGIYTGRWRTGCAAGPIPASVAMDVDSTVPAETSVAYPDSVLLFVHEGDLVRVYEYPAT
ncbi:MULTISPECIES: hypothetical protein [Microbacterium]|uniref:hypothetical protein n=1 Tax=Microbacterium TaxID=33882 RepID=UPI000C575B42|nr:MULTISPECIES: hypothetical protein [Microbacterium]MAB19852.1 hypothetical protein [Microbacterium sp.]MAM55512.1 hypothetical protein [Microbacterium sp.]HAS33498.1 hypothetical protein [Microbacterium sp.]|tara:strand:+ start:668 stop:1453 length:786 start_codon:yes stop_codon:yes gene_type:complete